MKVVGKGNTGYGFLYEYDAGYISSDDNAQLIKEIKENINKKTFDLKNPVIIGVMQKFGRENKNGRIYPESVLKRQVEEYRKLIQMGASAGESDHPDCFTPTAEILTDQGWKFIKDIDEDEKIYTLSSEGKLEIQQITKKVYEPYKGEMIKIVSEDIDCEVTPNHRLLFSNKNQNLTYISAQEFIDIDANFLNTNHIPKNLENTEKISLDQNNLSINKFDYEGDVVCVRVPNQNFYVRQNGKAHWTGNSAVISIKNTSMRITDLWWQGSTLMGKIYLPITRGYIERGIISHPADKVAHDLIHGFRYGVSSRGVGSVENVGGKKVVQDDFELICWDFVTTPSTPGSWVSPDQSDLEQYIESSIPDESKYLKNNNKSTDIFAKLKNSRKKSLDTVLNNFMRSFK